ncbi:alpha/beta hydrolase [Pseudomonas sp.]|uniref:alpha/beta fold hydrolase n=1 Tax=Pseudomonas sp. TaxID=306 RepID=UPI0028B10778|nr:alpha/beta hydrolase [Pseudomonas sp.]
MLRATALALTCLLGTPAIAAESPTYGKQLEGFTYPHPLKHFDFQSQGQALQMGYMDVPAKSQANGRSVVLMHGKNFCAATWETTIDALSQAGFRVIALDQIGFCTSSKPAAYQYSFQQLAVNTHALLEHLGITQSIVLGHSTGGMLATRYALMYPQQVERLAMVNPIGLEDWKALGVPYRTVDQWYARELKLDADGVREYERKTYYAGRWKPEYERWVQMLVGLNKGPGHEAVAWNSALIYDMIFTQPVYHEFKDLQMPTLLLIGDQDSTAIGSDIAPAEVKAKLGKYQQLGPLVAKMIPQGELITFEGMGHAPQIEEPRRFNRTLVEWLGR